MLGVSCRHGFRAKLVRKLLATITYALNDTLSMANEQYNRLFLRNSEHIYKSV